MSKSKELAIRSGSVLHRLANKMAPDLDPDKFIDVIKATCLPKDVSIENLAAFLMVAAEHGLSPVKREIYGFPARGGGVQPVVGVDGWVRLANEHPAFDGMEFVDMFNPENANELVAVTCSIYRKDRSHPIRATEYMIECRRQTDPWKSHPRRMLRHKATIQAIRLAFGFAGIVDAEEYERVVEVEAQEQKLAQIAAGPAKRHVQNDFMDWLQVNDVQRNEAEEAAQELFQHRIDVCTEEQLEQIKANLMLGRDAELEGDEDGEIESLSMFDEGEK